jgi:hypothetical protein
MEAMDGAAQVLGPAQPLEWSTAANGRRLAPVLTAQYRGSSSAGRSGKGRHRQRTSGTVAGRGASARSMFPEIGEWALGQLKRVAALGAANGRFRRVSLLSFQS